MPLGQISFGIVVLGTAYWHCGVGNGKGGVFSGKGGHSSPRLRAGHNHSNIETKLV